MCKRGKLGNLRREESSSSGQRFGLSGQTWQFTLNRTAVGYFQSEVCGECFIDFVDISVEATLSPEPKILLMWPRSVKSRCRICMSGNETAE
jgi:hypothetical protein